MKSLIISNLKNIMKEADAFIRKNRKLEIRSKEGNGNLVTSVDIKLNEYITHKLNEIYPEAEIISEEMQNIGQKNSSLKFVIDPIDGTSNFLKGWPCSVSIGAIFKEELVAGMILDINSRDVYYATKNGGAYRYNLSNSNKIIKININKSKINDIQKAIVSYDFPYSDVAFDNTQKVVASLYRNGAKLKTIGPISLEILKCGLGKNNRQNDYNDVCFHLEVRPWDVAAATCIIRELGFELYSLKNNATPIDINELVDKEATIAFVATNSEILATHIYNEYNHVVYEYDKQFVEVTKKAKCAREKI